MSVPADAPLPKLYHPGVWRDPPGGAEAVSIIMRTKDRALLLPRALESVLAQRFEDWRLYLVNDGGAVPVLEDVLTPYLEAFGGRLRVVHHAVSLGMEAASNAGLALARGRYFAIHDDDDCWHPDFLSRTVSFLSAPERCGYAGVATGCEVVRERIEAGRVVKTAQFPWVYFKPPVEFSAMLARNQIPPIALLLRRDVLARIGDYNERLPVLGDWEFILRVLAVGDIGAIPEPLAFYHHRLAADEDVYANSVSAGLHIHREMKAGIGNHIIREALAAQPVLLGVLWPVLQALDEASGERRRQTEGLEHKLDALAAEMARQLDMMQGMTRRLTVLEEAVREVRQIAEQRSCLPAPLRWLAFRWHKLTGRQPRKDR
ncbi:glycosyltransferase family 2 protein [Acidocella sp.]|uniref:glycosyltransferase family 2 protein n=1 Tax=Acidocella sp. TaxID=50710 RepID=UPI003D091A3D